MSTRAEEIKRRDAERGNRRAKACRHFTGLLNGNCEAGVDYPNRYEHAAGALPCFADEGALPCNQYSPLTADELARKEEEAERRNACYVNGKSPCCDAEIDTSRVHTSGRHKGHGPRFCSKCQTLLFLV